MKKTISIILLCGLLIVLMLACNLPGPFGKVQSGVNTVESIKETAEGFTTLIPEDAVITMEALASEMPPGMDETVVALLTAGLPEDPESAVQTAEALLPALPGLGGDSAAQDAPPDIPLLENRNDDLYATKDVVSYTTPLSFQEVVTFYKDNMLLNEWSYLSDQSVETEDAAVLYYEKPGRNAIVTLSISGGQTSVMITITPK